MEVTIFKELAAKAPKFALEYGPKLLMLGKKGIEIIKTILEINKFNGKIVLEEKNKMVSYQKIGKEICEENLKEFSTNVKKEINMVENANKNIIKYKNEKKNLEEKLKKQLDEVGLNIDIKKIFNDAKDTVLNLTNPKEKIKSKSSKNKTSSSSKNIKKASSTKKKASKKNTTTKKKNSSSKTLE